MLYQKGIEICIIRVFGKSEEMLKAEEDLGREIGDTVGGQLLEERDVEIEFL